MIGTVVFHQKQGISKLLPNVRQLEWICKYECLFSRIAFLQDWQGDQTFKGSQEYRGKRTLYQYTKHAFERFP